MPQFDNKIKDPQGLGKKNWILLNRNVHNVLLVLHILYISSSSFLSYIQLYYHIHSIRNGKSFPK